MTSSQASSSKVTLDDHGPPDEDDDVALANDDSLLGLGHAPSNRDPFKRPLRPSLADSTTSSTSRLLKRPPAHPQVSRLRSSSNQILQHKLQQQHLPASPRRTASNSTTASAFVQGRRLPSIASSFLGDSQSQRSSASNLRDLPTDVVFSSEQSSTPFPPASEVDHNDLLLLHNDGDQDSTLASKRGRRATSTFKWNVLRRISSKAYSPAAIEVKGLIVIGTDSGWTLVFDFGQNLRCRLGTDALVQESGPVTAVTISQDHTFVAVGHAKGSIHLYSLAKPAQPQRSVLPTTLAEVKAGRREGHLQGSKIVRLGFVGARHTAIVSTDDQHLAFYHSLGKVLMLSSNDVVRILGRYPDRMPDEQSQSLRNASETSAGTPSGRHAAPIADMATLPFGTVPHPSDDLFLAALMTPSKLVVVGLKPAARTWWRTTHSKLSEKEPASTAVLAWYPSVSSAASASGERHQPQKAEDPVLAYAWDRRVHFVIVRRGSADDAAQSNVNLAVRFEEAGEFSCQDLVLGLQWFNGQVLLVETSTGIEVWDVKRRKRLGGERLDLSSIVSSDESVLPSRSSHLSQAITVGSSCVCHKQKLFLLTRKELKVATILSWADHVLALMQPSSILDAIELTTEYYLGRTDASTLSLPLDSNERKASVEPKLREILSGSLDFIFSEERLKDGSHSDGESVQRLFERLVPVCINACVALDDIDWLFDELYERYEQNGIQNIFLDRVEPFVLSGSVQALPPSVTQRLIDIQAQRGDFDAVQRIVWHVDPLNIDINQALTICQKHKLWDALIHVYMRSLRDYVAPLAELVAVIRKIQHDRRERPRHVEAGDQDDVEPSSAWANSTAERDIPDAYKIYDYLVAVLTGLSYPDEVPLERRDANEARNAVYNFLFASKVVRWPAQSGSLIKTVVDGNEPSFPYLRLLLQFDSESLLDALDAAFEDAYLNDDVPGRPLDRQLIVNVLLDLFEKSPDAFTSNDRTFLDIFIARNVPKYPQFVRLGPAVLEKVLEDLASDGDMSTLEDRQLAAEYLLSNHSPSDSVKIVGLFEQAGFFRILRSIYRGERKWAALASTYLRDPEMASDLFVALKDILVQASKANAKQKAELEETIVEAVPALIDASEESLLQTAHLVGSYFPSRHADVVDKLSSSDWRQMAYLRCLLEPDAIPITVEEGHVVPPRFSPSNHVDDKHKLRYLQLLCQHQPQDVLRYIDASPSEQLPPEDEVMRICEQSDVLDALVWIIARTDVPLALKRADEALESRTELLMHALYQGPSVDDFHLGDPSQQGATAEIDRYVEQIVAVEQAAIRICSNTDAGSKGSEEDRWFGLLSSLVDTVRSVRTIMPQPPRPSDRSSSARRKVSGASIILRDTDTSERLLSPWAAEQLSLLLPTALTALVSSSTSRVHFPRLMRRLIDVKARSPAADRAYSEFKAIVHSMLDTYASENETLSLSAKIVSQDLFAYAAELARRRAYGWKPTRGVCAECCQPLWRASSTSNKTRLLFDDRVGQTFDVMSRDMRRGASGDGAVGMSESMERSASIVKTIATSPDRPKLKKVFSMKGKEVDWPSFQQQPQQQQETERNAGEQQDSAAREEGQGKGGASRRGIVIRADGRVFHRACHLLALQRE